MKFDLKPIQEIMSVLRYEPESGLFYWTETRGRGRAGYIAGFKDRGYLSLRVFGKSIQLHRLAYAFMTGEWPELTIDHINGEKQDNRWSNLRMVSTKINNQNIRKAKQKSKSGLLGAHWVKRLNKWKSAIGVDGVVKHIGYFDTPEEAHMAYVEKKREFHDGCTI